MIDNTNTTVEWQKYSGDILVFPVGSTEQHDAHLPLNTDTIHAEYFSRMIAEKFDAALLPVQAIATSLEHDGFRGSFSLHPETLMQIVRDIADEAERQSFRILIVVNGHGGNHSLVPVCRDINRLNRKIKILHINPWEFVDLSHDKIMDVHAGKFETSMVLIEKPEAVKHTKGTPTFESGAIPLSQRDLTTFGIGHYNANGSIGHYDAASKEEGEYVIENIRKNMISYVSDRIDRLYNQPRYVGTGGLAIRNMINNDIPTMIKLSDLASWNQTDADWKAFLDLNKEGCFVMVHMGIPVASITTLGYGGKISWIGMVLVDDAFRRMGIASALMNNAVNFLQEYEVIKLDATPDGRKVYEKLGFKDECSISRMIVNVASSSGENSDKISPITMNDLQEIIQKDKSVFLADRTNILKYFWKTFPDLCFKYTEKNKIIAYSFGRHGRKFTQIGPIIADNYEAAVALFNGIMCVLKGQTVAIDAMDTNASFIKYLEGQKFIRQRYFIRMYKGEKAYSSDSEQYFAIAGPEFG